MDSQIAGTHFPPGLDPALVARRLLAVNLSDLAAMGAEPAYALLALTAPRGFDYRRFFRALLAACARHRLQLAGGDLSRDPRGGLAATLTLFGKRRRGGRWLHRAGAAAGHRLWLGGSVGESAAGRMLIAAGARLERGRVTLPAGWDGAGAKHRRLAAAARRAVRRHLLPAAQLPLGWWLARQPVGASGTAGAIEGGGAGGTAGASEGGGASGTVGAVGTRGAAARERRAGAAIDVSDGVARDLHRLCGASGVGARLDVGRLPLAAGFAPLCAALGADPLELALGGGEDYVLLFTLPAALAPPPRFGCHAVGTITRSRGVSIGAGNSTGSRALSPSGWDHLAGR